MSVILFNSKKDSVFAEMATSYENLKHFARVHAYRTFSETDDYAFYKSLRRLYFANVACWLCQYHDESPLPQGEILSIETFSNIDCLKPGPILPPGEHVHNFLEAWGSLNYNLCTNDGEFYKPLESHELITNLAQSYGRALASSVTEGR